MSNACEVVPWLVSQGRTTIEAALAEKAEAVATAVRVAELLATITTFPPSDSGDESLVKSQVLVTAEYAVELFRAIEAGWVVLLEGYQLDKTSGSSSSSSSSSVDGSEDVGTRIGAGTGTGTGIGTALGTGLTSSGGNRTRLCEAAEAYASAWVSLSLLHTDGAGAAHNSCPTLYDDQHWAYAPIGPDGNSTGMGADVARFYARYCSATPPAQGTCQCDAGDFWCSGDDKLRRNFNCSGSCLLYTSPSPRDRG